MASTALIPIDLPERDERGRPGRPSKFVARQAWYTYTAAALAAVGMRDDQIAQALGIDDSTYAVWRRKYPEFRGSIDSVRADPDMHVEAAAFKRATGYWIEEEKAHWDAEARSWQTITQRRFVPPDPRANSLWLCNRRPDRWRVANSGVNVTHGGSVSVEHSLRAVPEDELDARLRAMGFDPEAVIEAVIVDSAEPEAET